MRSAAAGETMKTLDGQERQLAAEDLVIADAEGPVALAGVMGGENSEVRPDTTAILLESANFDSRPHPRTAARLGLRTEASARFEKSLDPELAMHAALRFTCLVLETRARARAWPAPVADRYPRPYPPVDASTCPTAWSGGGSACASGTTASGASSTPWVRGPRARASTSTCACLPGAPRRTSDVRRGPRRGGRAHRGL